MKQLLLLHLFFVGIALGAWQDGVEIKSHLRRDELAILGSFDGHPEDHLSILQANLGYVLIGARDALYNLSSHDLKQNSILTWKVASLHKEMCQIKGQKDSECHNFLRLFHGPVTQHHNYNQDLANASQNSTKKFIVCGTNAYKPVCRYYDSELANFTEEFTGIGYAPHDPTHKSTSVLHHGSIYAGTVADFGGTDALIYKEPLRTEQHDPKHLNSPSFVSSSSYGDLALFFFKEFAVEYGNCGKAMFSRVARICRNDSGSRKHKDRFTTFLKARLNCSVPGEYPFYFDHIQGTTDVFTDPGNKSRDMMYAVFTTPENSLGASAVCSFAMNDILQVFEGPFKGQTSFDSNWLPVPPNDVPSPRPGSCSSDSNYSPDSNSVVFHKSHPLMDEAVQGNLVLTYTSNKLKFSAITVDVSPENSPFHIVYLGTDTGQVFKAVVNATSNISIDIDESDEDQVMLKNSAISQSWTVFRGNEAIKTLRLLSSKRLLVSTESQLVIIRVDNCERFPSCQKCLKIQDPHCAWNLDKRSCVPKDPDFPDRDLDENLIQDVSTGDTNLCLPDERNNEINDANLGNVFNNQKGGEDCCPCATTPRSIETENKIPEWIGDLPYRGSESSSEQIVISAENESFHSNEIPRRNNPPDFESSFVKSDDGTLSSQSIVIATLSSTILSLLIGFSLGFLASRWLSSRHNHATEPSTNALVTLTESQRLTKPIDFVVNVPSMIKSPLKNNISTEETLEKTKKVYL